MIITTHGNEIFLGDNVETLRRLQSTGVRFTLVYADIPFFTQQDWCTTDGELAYSDRWDSVFDYRNAMCAALGRAFDLLTPDGSIVVHCDQRASHFLKCDLDASFGRDHFASEIIWRYRRWPSKTTNFQRVHDVLLRYVRDPKVTPRFNQLYEPLAESTRKQWGTRKQRAIVDADGRRLRSSSTDTESPGVPLGDVWDIPIVAPVAHERTGYPTQKPEALVERLVLALSDPGDFVLDPFVGSGTTAVVCARLGRHFIGIDSSEVAVRMSRERLAKIRPPLSAGGT